MGGRVGERNLGGGTLPTKFKDSEGRGRAVSKRSAQEMKDYLVSGVGMERSWKDATSYSMDELIKDLFISLGDDAMESYNMLKDYYGEDAKNHIRLDSNEEPIVVLDKWVEATDSDGNVIRNQDGSPKMKNVPTEYAINQLGLSAGDFEKPITGAAIVGASALGGLMAGGPIGGLIAGLGGRLAAKKAIRTVLKKSGAKGLGEWVRGKTPDLVKKMGRYAAAGAIGETGRQGIQYTQGGEVDPLTIGITSAFSGIGGALFPSRKLDNLAESRDPSEIAKGSAEGFTVNDAPTLRKAINDLVSERSSKTDVEQIAAYSKQIGEKYGEAFARYGSRDDKFSVWNAFYSGLSSNARRAVNNPKDDFMEGFFEATGNRKQIGDNMFTWLKDRPFNKGAERFRSYANRRTLYGKRQDLRAHDIDRVRGGGGGLGLLGGGYLGYQAGGGMESLAAGELFTPIAYATGGYLAERGLPSLKRGFGRLKRGFQREFPYEGGVRGRIRPSAMVGLTGSASPSVEPFFSDIQF